MNQCVRKQAVYWEQLPAWAPISWEFSVLLKLGFSEFPEFGLSATAPGRLTSAHLRKFKAGSRYSESSFWQNPRQPRNDLVVDIIRGHDGTGSIQVDELFGALIVPVAAGNGNKVQRACAGDGPVWPAT